MPAIEYQGRNEWLQARRKCIGSSDVPALFGLGYAGQSPLTVYADKIATEPQRRTEAEHKRLRKGQIAEEFVLRLFEEQEDIKTHRHTAPCIDFHPELPYVGASIDAWAVEDGGASIVVEAKMVSPQMRHEWEGPNPPIRHAIQVQHQLWCTGWQRGYLVGWCGGDDVTVFEIGRNQGFIDLLAERCEQFWTRHVLPKIPPQPDGSDGAAEAIRRLFPVDSGQVIALDRLSMQMVDKLDRAKSRIKKLTDIRGAIENRIKLRMGEATYGALPDGRCVSWKLQDRREYVVEATSYRVFRVHAKTPKEVELAIVRPLGRGMAC